MHEVGLMVEVIALAEEAAAGRRVHRLMLRVGPLAGVDPEALLFAFDVAARGTAAEGAVLELRETAVVCACEVCGREFQPAGEGYECPECGRPSADVRAGRELVLESVEVS